MKKKIVVLSVGFALLLLAACAAQGLSAAAADDYQVIKNAVKSQEPSRAGHKSAQWLKILVTGRNGDHEKVKITLPVSLMELMIKSCPENKFNVDHGCQIDLQRVWNDLKAAGPLALVEVEEHGETVKIWLE